MPGRNKIVLRIKLGEIGFEHRQALQVTDYVKELLKTAYYRRYEPQLGVERPTETVIIDGLDPNWVTVMPYTEYAWRDVPEAWLQREYLPRFKPE